MLISFLYSTLRWSLRLGRYTKQDYVVMLVIGSIGTILLLGAVWPHLIAPELNPTSRQQGIGARMIPYIFLILAAMLTLIHIQIAWINPLIYYIRHRSFENYIQPSGAPLFVECLLIFGSRLATTSTSIGIFIVVVGLINPAGLHWAFLSLFRMARE